MTVLWNKDRASRVDAHTGAKEEVEFFEVGTEQIFGVRTSPVDSPSGGVVICAPIHAEFTKNYRRETLLARALAAQGFAVQRFHYRGTGHSDGDVRDMTFESMHEDAVGAAEALVRDTEVADLTFVGTRLGGFVAAAAAQSWDGARVVLWDPISDHRKYFREVVKTKMITNLKEGDGPRVSTEELLNRLRTEGLLDVLGYPIDIRLHDSFVERSLATVLEGSARAVLLVKLSRSKELGEDPAVLQGRLRDRGLAVDLRGVGEREAWWLEIGQWDNADERLTARATIAEELIAVTTDWITQQFTTEVAV